MREQEVQILLELEQPLLYEDYFLLLAPHG
jgi:hypothetical protein